MDPKDLVPWLMGIVQLLLLGAWRDVHAKLKERKEEHEELERAHAALVRQFDSAGHPTRGEFTTQGELIRQMSVTIARIEAKVDALGVTQVHKSGSRGRGDS